MKVKCRRCDICEVEMDGRDFQFWLRTPRIKRGVPELGMKNMDICLSCFSKLATLVLHPEFLDEVGISDEADK